MRKTFFGILAATLLCSGCNPVSKNGQSLESTQAAPSLAERLTAAGLVELKGGVEVDLAYAKDDPTGEINFLKKNVYGTLKSCYLQKAVSAKLNSAQIVLKRTLGGQATLVMYDCARPLSVQKAMWKILPDARYVADPATGSKHNFGASVDLTFRAADGKIADMGTRFDHFGPESAYDYPNISAKAKENRAILRKAMQQGGLLPYNGEWWHFDGHPSPRTEYEILDF